MSATRPVETVFVTGVLVEQGFTILELPDAVPVEAGFAEELGVVTKLGVVVTVPLVPVWLAEVGLTPDTADPLPPVVVLLGGGGGGGGGGGALLGGGVGGG